MQHRKQPKQLRELLKMHKDLPNKRNRILKRKSERRDRSLNLLPMLRDKLKQPKPGLKLRQKGGRYWQSKLWLNLRESKKLPLPLWLKRRLNSRLKNRESKLSMTLLLKLRKRHTDLPL